MKTIEEKAKEYARQCVSNPDSNEYPSISSGDIYDYINESYIAGANFILDQLRWRNVEDELPTIGSTVVVRKNADFDIYTIKGNSQINAIIEKYIHWKPIEL